MQIIVRFAQLDDFLEELGEMKASVKGPVRISTFPAPPHPDDDGPPPWVTKVGAIAGDQLLELTVIDAGEASAEQTETKLLAKIDAEGLTAATGSQYGIA